MSLIRPVLVLLGLLVPLVVVAAPAHAAGERCVTQRNVERCASMINVSTDETNFYAQGYVGSLRYPRIKVRYVWVEMQRRTSDGWVRAAPRNTNLNQDRFRSLSSTSSRACAGAPSGVYRSRTKVEWKVRGESRVHTAKVASRGVRKARLC